MKNTADNNAGKGTDSDMIEVSIVMPCLNEEKAVGICVRKAVSAIKKMGINGEVIVADNGSTDNSVRIARAAGARVVHESAKGYGSAYLKGFSEAKGKYIIMGDADDTYDFLQAPKFIAELRKGYDFVTGTRLAGKIERGAMPFLHYYLGNPMLTRIMNLFFGTKYSDVYSGMRAFTREAYDKIMPVSRGMEFNLELAINAAKCGLKIKEIPIVLHERKGEAKLRTFRDGWRSMRFMLLYSPYHLFFIPGIIMLLIGIIGLSILSFADIAFGSVQLGPVSAMLGSLFAIMGFQAILFGYFAKLAYSKMNRYDKKLHGAAKAIGRLLNFERGLIIGGLIIAAGIVIDSVILTTWLRGNMGPLPLRDISIAVSALTITIFGLQIMFSAFLNSIMKME
jgi:glycosyltransferase involved in cell wall biosynthesis